MNAAELRRELAALSDAEYRDRAADAFAGDAFRSTFELFRKDGTRKPLWVDQVAIHLERAAAR